MGFWSIVGAGITDGWTSIRRNFLVFVFALLASAVIEFVFQNISVPYVKAATAGMTWGLQPDFSRIVLLGAVKSALLGLAVAPCMIATHRFVLLGETTARLELGRRYLAFALCLAALHVLPSIPGAMTGFWGEIPAFIVSAYFTVRLALMFPAVALGRKRPWVESWSLTRGHWWFVTGVMFCGFLPYVLGLFVAVAVIGFTIAASHASAGSGFGAWGLGVATVLSATVFPATGAALASGLYRRFGGVAG